MGLKLGDEVPKVCTPLQSGMLLRLPGLTFPDGNLTKVTGNPNKNKLIRNSRKAAYIAYESNQGINVCDQPDFCKLEFVPKMTIKLSPKCPFRNGVTSYGLKITAVYDEGINPSNHTTSPLLEDFSFVFTDGGPSTINTLLQTQSIGDPYGIGSTGIGTFNLNIELREIDATPFSGTQFIITATLISFGKAAGLFGGTVRNLVLNCDGLGGAIEGGQTGSFWSGIGSAVVFSLQFRVIGTDITP